jgi:hypothetical protein
VNISGNNEVCQVGTTVTDEPEISRSKPKNQNHWVSELCLSSRILNNCRKQRDRLCGLVARVLVYRFGGPGSIPGTTRKKSSGSVMGFTQPREYN